MSNRRKFQLPRAQVPINSARIARRSYPGRFANRGQLWEGNDLYRAAWITTERICRSYYRKRYGFYVKQGYWMYRHGRAHDILSRVRMPPSTEPQRQCRFLLPPLQRLAGFEHIQAARIDAHHWDPQAKRRWPSKQLEFDGEQSQQACNIHLELNVKFIHHS